MAISIQQPSLSEQRIIAVEITGQVTAGDMKVLIDELQKLVNQNERALLLVDMQHYEGFEFGVVTEKFKHMGLLWKSIEKYAIVGAAHWMEVWVKMVNPLTPMQMRAFEADESKAAWQWLRESAAPESQTP